MRVQTQENLSFRAKLLSQWRCSSTNNKTKNVAIVSIDKSDLAFAEKFIKYIGNLKNDNKSAKEIMDNSSKTILEILKSDIYDSEKIKIYIATYDEIPCGIFVANMPKFLPNNTTVLHSSRHNPAKKETELDWLVTWNPKGNEKLKGVGKALVGEFFRTVKQDNFRDVFVRSEVPEKSYAKNFYESLGFEQIGKKRVRLFNRNSAQSLINDYTEKNDETVPMLITRSKIQEIAKKLASKMGRKEFKENSVSAEDLISL